MSKMVNQNSITIEKRTLEFLLYSYFGKANNAVDAAINAAYRDMAAHTLRRDVNGPSGIDDKVWKQKKEECKKAAIARFKEILNELSEYKDLNQYCEWHKKICTSLNKEYNEKEAQLTFGQAQKWVNMTMKYLYMFYLLKKDGAMGHIFLDNKQQSRYELDDKLETAIEHTWGFYHVPIDNYILGVFYEERKKLQLNVNIRNSGGTYKIEFDNKQYSWSRIPFDVSAGGEVEETACLVYYNLQKELREQLGNHDEPMLLWEFDNWIQAAIQK